jgi:hypothetical protein
VPGRGPALWLSSLLVCSECGSTCSNGTRFRIADIEREVLAALELDFLSPDALQRATDLAMEYFDKQQSTEVKAAPAVSAGSPRSTRGRLMCESSSKPESSRHRCSKVGLPNSRRSGKRSIVPPRKDRHGSTRTEEAHSARI